LRYQDRETGSSDPLTVEPLGRFVLFTTMGEDNAAPAAA
jgi:hypothetical protein